MSRGALNLAELRDHAQRRLVEIDAERVGLVAVLASLNVGAGAAARAKAKGGSATGTKALILDVLAEAREPMRAIDIAKACKVKFHGGFNAQLKQLVSSGDVTKVGGGCTTRYRI